MRRFLEKLRLFRQGIVRYYFDYALRSDCVLQLSCMKRLIFVSSEPSLALRNLVDLCKPKWKRYEGEPFKLASITPIDMFPHTERCEWVVQLDRHS